MTDKSWASTFDPEKVKEAMEQMQRSGANFDKLETGSKYTDNYRRIAPKRPEWEFPFVIAPAHFRVGIGNRTLGCLREAKIGECPLCQYGFQLNDEGDKKAASAILPNWSIYTNVVTLDQAGEMDESKGIRILRFNQTQWDLVWDEFEQHGDLSHIETGRNLRIRAKEEKKGDFTFNVLKISVSEPSPFPGTTKMLDEQLNDLASIVEFVDADEMLSIMEGQSAGALPSGTVSRALPGPAPVVEVKPGGFADEVEEDETPPDPEQEEEEVEEATPPKVDSAAAISRLTQRVQKPKGSKKVSK